MARPAIVFSNTSVLYHNYFYFASTTQSVTHNTTLFIYGRVGQPSHRAVYLTYMQNVEAPKPDTKTPKKQQVEKTPRTCTPEQGSGATLGVLGYASA